MQAQSEVKEVVADLDHISKDQQQKPAEGQGRRGDGPKAVGRPPAGGTGETGGGAKAADQQDSEHRRTSPALRTAAKVRAVGKVLKRQGLLPKEKRCNSGKLEGKTSVDHAVPSDSDSCTCGGSCKEFREEHKFPLNLPVVDFAGSSIYLSASKAATLLAWAQTGLKHEAAQAELLNELADLDSKYAAEDAAYERLKQSKVSSPCCPCIHSICFLH